MNKITRDTTIGELQDYVAKMLVERGFKGQSLSRTFVGLVEEIGELAEIIKNIEKQNRHKGKAYNLPEEIADVLIYILDIACECDVDIAEALEKKEAKNRKRKWLTVQAENL